MYEVGAGFQVEIEKVLKVNQCKMLHYCLKVVFGLDLNNTDGKSPYREELLSALSLRLNTSGLICAQMIPSIRGAASAV